MDENVPFYQLQFKDVKIDTTGKGNLPTILETNVKDTKTGRYGSTERDNQNAEEIVRNSIEVPIQRISMASKIPGIMEMSPSLGRVQTQHINTTNQGSPTFIPKQSDEGGNSPRKVLVKSFDIGPIKG